MAKKSKYTAAQKAAYYMGKGYALGRANKKIPYKNEEKKSSFAKGYREINSSIKKSK